MVPMVTLVKKLGGAMIVPYRLFAPYSGSHHSGLSSPMPWAQ